MLAKQFCNLLTELGKCFLPRRNASKWPDHIPNGEDQDTVS